MAQAKILTVGGTNYEMIDDTARTTATTALNNAEYNRQGLIGKYPGQSLAALLEQMREQASQPTQTETNTANIDYLLMTVGGDQ